jgi:hypothetical protein
MIKVPAATGTTVFPVNSLCPPLEDGVNLHTKDTGNILDGKVIGIQGSARLKRERQQLTVGLRYHSCVPGIFCGSPHFPGEITRSPSAHNFSNFPFERISRSSSHTDGVVNNSPSTGYSEKKTLASRMDFMRLPGTGMGKWESPSSAPCQWFGCVCSAWAIWSAADTLLHPRSIVSLQITSRTPASISRT